MELLLDDGVYRQKASQSQSGAERKLTGYIFSGTQGHSQEGSGGRTTERYYRLDPHTWVTKQPRGFGRVTYRFKFTILSAVI